MKHTHQQVVLGAALTLVSPFLMAQDGPTKVLIEQGQYWQSQGRSDRAIEAWMKLLRLDPDQPEALAGMVQAEIDAGNRSSAMAFLERLKRVRPNAPAIARLQESLTGSGGVRQSGLDEARQLARSGKAAEAVSKYREIFAGRSPEGPAALEYYQTLGGTTEGWAEARTGLENIVKRSPDDVQAQLALAQHLTYRETTRREGIRQLIQLQGNPRVAKPAADSWRQALGWLSARGNDAPLYQSYLALYPDDAVLQTRLDALRKSGNAVAGAAEAASNTALNEVLAAGFKALNDGDNEVAEQQFNDVLAKSPGNPEAQGGLGIILLRQQKFAEAKVLLEKAVRRNPSGRWSGALNSANYWLLVGQADDARIAGDNDAAIRLLERSLKLAGDDNTAEVTLAGLYAQAGQLSVAEASYRKVLKREPDNVAALRGLTDVLSQLNRPDEALALVANLSPERQQTLGSVGKLRAEQAKAQAKSALAKGDALGAQAALEDALLNDPTNPWVRLDLARLYNQQGARAQAKGVVEGLLLSNPSPDVLHASALLASESKEWTEGLKRLDAVPAKSRTKEMAALNRRLWVLAETDKASALVTTGRQAEALSVLRGIEPYVGDDLELISATATAFADAGDEVKALSLMRQLISRTTRQSNALRLAYASILLKTKQDIELAGILRQLQSSDLTVSERMAFDSLRMGYTIRQAEFLRQSGDLAAAYDVMAPALAEQPADAGLNTLLARMYTDANDHRQALVIYSNLLQVDPGNAGLMANAMGAAISAREYAYAEQVLQAGLNRHPDDPALLAAGGRLYRAQGKNSKAAEFFNAAVAVENRTLERRLNTGLSGPNVDNANPFAGRNVKGGTATVFSTTPNPNPFAPRGASALPFVAGPSPVSGATPVPAMVRDGGGFASPAASSYRPASLYGPVAAQAAVPPNPQGLFNRGDAPQRPANAPDSYLPVSSPAVRPNPVTSGKNAPKPAPGQPPQTPQRTLPAALPVSASQASRGETYATAPTYFPAAQPAPTAVPAYPPLPRVGGSGYAPQTRGLPAVSLSQAQSELNALNADQGPVLSAGSSLRTRAGESGLSKLTEFEAILEGKTSVGDGQVAVRLSPVALDSGTPDGNFNTVSRFGAGPAASIGQALSPTAVLPASQSATGVGVSAAYENGGFRADIGTTPLGFEFTNVVGGLKYGDTFGDNFNYAAAVSRRAVTDSLLSYAGASDNRGNIRWGGVTSTGGRFDLGWDDQVYGSYGYGEYRTLDGKNVAGNSKFEIGAGVYGRFIATPDQGLKLGVNFSYLSYDRNLRYFTLGHGGYFSPQQYFALTVPATWTKRSGNLSWAVKGAVGVQSFKEDSAPYFPTSSSRQASAQSAQTAASALGLTSNASAVYPGQSKTGLAFNAQTYLEYKLSPQLVLGGRLAVDQSADYRQFTGGLYVRYTFAPNPRPLNLEFAPLQSDYSN